MSVGDNVSFISRSFDVLAICGWRVQTSTQGTLTAVVNVQTCLDVNVELARKGNGDI